MSEDPLAGWGNRESLTADGTTVLEWSRGDTDRDGRPRADGAVRPEGVDVADCADVVLRELAGWALSAGDHDLVAALEGRGARVLRSVLSMSLALAEEPTLRGVPDQVSLAALTPEGLAEQADEIGAVAFRAHGSGERGWRNEADVASDMRRVAAGEARGPLLDSSVLATRGTAIIGACLITDRPGEPPHGGPWVSDIFRHPTDPAKGVGGAMLAHAARSLRSVGLAALSLVVTADNEPAITLYRSLGFEDHGQSWTLALP